MNEVRKEEGREKEKVGVGREGVGKTKKKTNCWGVKACEKKTILSFHHEPCYMFFLCVFFFIKEFTNFFGCCNT
jgi:hypothetical protein